MPAPAVPLRTPGAAESGQASVELVVVLPLLAVLIAGAWQGLLVAEAVWQARVASRAAARADSFGADAAAAARSHLPAGLERGMRVTEPADGDVRVSIRIPALVPSLDLGRTVATSHFQSQAG